MRWQFCENRQDWLIGKLPDGSSLLENHTHSGVLSTLHSLYFPTWATTNRHFCFIPPSTHFLRVSNCPDQSSPITLKGPYRNYAAMPQPYNSDNLKEQFVAQLDRENATIGGGIFLAYSTRKKKFNILKLCIFKSRMLIFFCLLNVHIKSSISGTEEHLKKSWGSHGASGELNLNTLCPFTSHLVKVVFLQST